MPSTQGKKAEMTTLSKENTSKPPTPKIKLRATVQRVTYADQDSGFVILRVKPKRGGSFTVKGYMSELASNATVVGAEFEFTGSWQMTKYGRQFDFSHYSLLGSELQFFLSKVVKGLGEKMARDLIEQFGEEELVRILDNEPERLLKVKGIKEKRLSLIKRSWHKHRSLKSLASYLGSKGHITPNLLIRIYNHFGDQSVEIIKENPYKLTEIRGIGFKTADNIAISLGLPADSPWRIKAGISHVLINAAESDGHCYLEQRDLLATVKELLVTEEGPVSDARISAVLKKMILEGLIVLGDKGEVGLSSYKYMEDRLREFFLQRSKEFKRRTISLGEVSSFISDYENRNGIEFAEEQKEIIEKIATEPRLVFGLAGYAGTGKTTVCRAILELLSHYYARGEEIICCAFTGMASSRLRKTTGHEAVTIHSLLKYKGENQFEHGPDNPVPYKVIVLDEASMVNLSLFYRLARAIKPTALLILVGDPAQLPPIGAGNVFSDALRKGLIPSVHLVRIFRQGKESVLALFANEIRQGRIPTGVDHKHWNDFLYERIEPHNIFALKRQNKREQELKRFREENNQAILDRILELAAYYVKRLTHPAWDFQVLTPMRIGQLGTEILNSRLQDILNPSISSKGITRAGIRLKEGDKVVHLQNRDMEVMPWDMFIKEGKRFSKQEFIRIFNGNIGLVSRIDPESEQFFVVYPERIVVAYEFDHLGDIIELAYALTVHKAQGSQYRIVVIPLSNSHFIMLNNKWFYTAITRAEEKVYLIGQHFALKRACTNVEGVERLTWLKK